MGYLINNFPDVKLSFILVGEYLNLSKEEIHKLSPARQINSEKRDQFLLASPCLPGGISIPDLWLSSFSLITISSPSKNIYTRISGPLMAQAGMLFQKNTDRLYSSELAFEAHRLAASDLNIVCGPSKSANHSPELVCMASHNDLAIEYEVVKAAGLKPTDSPVIKYMASQQIITFLNENGESQVVDWHMLATPDWQAWVTMPVLKIFRFGMDFVAGLREARQNLWRVGPFLKRKIFLRESDES
jgi:hypothetical protein